jgi:hypothetical protein
LGRIVLDEHWFSHGIQMAEIKLPPSLYWTCLMGLRSWANLQWTERRNWEFSAGNLKGLDLRDAIEQCRSVKIYARWKITDNRRLQFNDKGNTYEEISSLVRKDLNENPPTVEEWEEAIAEKAIQEHRDGFVLLAVAPDLAADKLQSAIAEAYHEHLIAFPRAVGQQRARYKDWLSIISAFENDEASVHKAKSQIFVRFRRAIDGIDFS